MKLYLLSQDTNTEYDTYDSAVVVAGSWKKALKIHPDGKSEVPEKGDRDEVYGTWTSQENIKTKMIGEAHSSLIEGTVVCASFNAG